MGRTLEQLRLDAAAIFNAAVQAVDAARAVERAVRSIGDVLEIAGQKYSLTDVRRVLVIGAGKAAVPMAQALEALLGDRLSGGIVVTKYGQARPLKKITVIEAAHPIPDLAGLEGACRIAGLAREAAADDLVFLVLSGGASALLPYPQDGVTVADKQAVTQLLLRSGAAIQEINTLRRHLSQLKGGRLARLVYPAQLVGLIISDVVGDTLEDIASGPSAPDPTRFADCWRIIRKYRLEEWLPAAVRTIITRGIHGEITETVKADDITFTKVQNVIIASNHLATAVARAHAESLGYRSEVLSNHIEGESREVAKGQAAILKKILTEPSRQPVCLISGGETTVTLRGDGKGGRNQEFALAAAIEIAGTDGSVILSAGTDGIDGPTEAAGAIVDGGTVQRGDLHGLIAADFLARNDAHAYLQTTGDLLITGPTNTNVMDIQLMLAG